MTSWKYSRVGEKDLKTEKHQTNASLSPKKSFHSKADWVKDTQDDPCDVMMPMSKPGDKDYDC